jgi:lipopolysaccharide/colanic/teichoic acid biosynthesis glycosyltransferase
MSLVGPRPEDPRFIDAYSAAECAVFDVRPGITGPAALQFRHEEKLLVAAAADDVDDYYARGVLHEKLALDLEYVRTWTVRRVLVLLVRTLRALWQ